MEETTQEYKERKRCSDTYEGNDERGNLKQRGEERIVVERVHHIFLEAFDIETTRLLILTNMFFIVSNCISGTPWLLKILSELEKTGE